MIPPHVPHQAFAGAPPLRAPAGAKGSKRTMMIALAAVAVVGIAIAIAVATKSSGGGGGSGGASSVEGAVKQTFASIGAGDAEALMANANMTLIKGYADCETADAAQDAKELDDMRREFERAAKREKGASFEVLEITEPSSPEVKKAGEAIGKNCKLRKDLTAHKSEVKLRVTRAKTTYEQVATQTVLEIDGHFLVVGTPKMPGCSAAVARVMLLEQRLGEARNLEVTRCVADKWSPEVVECLTKSLSIEDVDGCLARLAGGAPAVKGWQLPQECKDYTAAIKRMESCNGLDPEMKKIFRDGHADSAKSSAWAGKRPPGALALLPQSCKTDVDNINRFVAEKCP